jgi:hypothetical protein
MFLTLLVLAAVLGFCLGPVWLITFTLFAVAINLAPVLIGLAVIAAAAAWLFQRYRR